MNWLDLLDDADLRTLIETLGLSGSWLSAPREDLVAALASQDSEALCMLRADHLAVLCGRRAVATGGSKRQRVERLLETLHGDDGDNEHDADQRSKRRAEEQVVAGFLRHWRTVLKRVRRGDDVAAERAERFLAASASARLRIAKRFYGEGHAARMAALNPAQVRELLAPWIELAVDPNPDTPISSLWLRQERPSESQCRSLPTSEYVLVIDLHAGGTSVDRYPGDGAYYDDLYERSASGFSAGGHVRLFKATGEPFTASEARSAYAGMRTDFLHGAKDADDDEWEAHGPDGFDDFQVVMRVNMRVDEESSEEED